MDTKLLGLILQGDKRIAREITDFKNTLSDAGLTESGAIVQTAAGESIVTRDSSDDGVKGLRVFGRSEQFSTTGANLFDKDNATYVSQISYNSNVYIKNGDTRSRLYYLPIEPNTDYYVSKTIGANLRVCVSSEVPAVDVKVSTINSNTSSSECVISSGTTGKYLGLYLLWSAELDAGMTYESVLDTVMVAKSNIAVPYEPYTGGIASPNPDFPQEIISAGDDGELEVGVYGGNLFNVDELFDSGATHECFEDGRRITVTGSKAYAHSRVNIQVQSLVGKMIYLKGTVTGGNSPAFTVALKFKDGTTIYVGSDTMRKGYLLDESMDYFEFQLICNNKSTALEASTTAMFEDVMLTLDPNAEWEPYKPAQSLPIPTPNGLPGIKVTDASLATYTDAEGNMWCADEIDFERGVYVKRIGEVEPDKWEWGTVKEGTSGSRFNAPIPVMRKQHIPCISTHYLQQKVDVWATEGNYLSANEAVSNGRISIRVSSTFSTSSEFRAFVKEEGVRVYYILATPIETPLTAAELNAYKALHTNCPVTTVLNDSGAHMEVKYNADTKNYIDNKFTELTNAILSMGGNV